MKIMNDVVLSKLDLKILKHIVRNGLQFTFDHSNNEEIKKFTHKEFREFCYRVGLQKELLILQV